MTHTLQVSSLVVALVAVVKHKDGDPSTQSTPDLGAMTNHLPTRGTRAQLVNRYFSLKSLLPLLRLLTVDFSFVHAALLVRGVSSDVPNIAKTYQLSSVGGSVSFLSQKIHPTLSRKFHWNSNRPPPRSKVREAFKSTSPATSSHAFSFIFPSSAFFLYHSRVLPILTCIVRQRCVGYSACTSKSHAL